MTDKLEVIIQSKELNELIAKFKLVNISYERLFPNKSQRKALERLVKLVGYDKVNKAIEMIAQTNGMAYAPDIRTPVELENKWSKWVDFVYKNRDKQTKVYEL